MRGSLWLGTWLALVTAAPLAGQREGGGSNQEADQDNPWSVEVSATALYDSNILNRAVSPGAFGIEPGVRVGVAPPGARGLRLQYEAVGHAYTETSRWDRLSQSLEARYRRRLGDRWSADLMAEAAVQVLTLEYARADQATLRPMVEYRATNDDRLRLYTAYRRRRYHDEDHSAANNGSVWLQYRRRLVPYHFAYAGVRVEGNRAEQAARDFTRTAAYVQYTGRIGRRDRLNGELEYRDERFHNLAGASGTGRREHRWVPSAGWSHEIGRAALELDYRFQTRSSPIPERAFDEHLVATTLRYRF